MGTFSRAEQHKARLPAHPGMPECFYRLSSHLRESCPVGKRRSRSRSPRRAGGQEGRPEACPGPGRAPQARRHKRGARARPSLHAAAVKSPGERDVPVLRLFFLVLFCFVVLFSRAASQARGAGRVRGQAARQRQRLSGGRRVESLTHPPEPPPASAKPVEQFPPVAGRRARRAAGGEREREKEREGGNAPPRNRFVLLYLLTFGRPR